MAKVPRDLQASLVCTVTGATTAEVQCVFLAVSPLTGKHEGKREMSREPQGCLLCYKRSKHLRVDGEASCWEHTA